MKRPTKEELIAAEEKRVELEDLVAPGLRLLLVGINPGRHSGATGFHFGNSRNHLWAALYGSGLTPRQLRPDEAPELLALGIGITNLVMRTTAGADAIEPAEYRDGVTVLREKVAILRPSMVAILTKHGYEKGFEKKLEAYGPQREPLEGSQLWVLPNPSPRNPRYDERYHVARYRELKQALDLAGRTQGSP